MREKTKSKGFMRFYTFILFVSVVLILSGCGGGGSGGGATQGSGLLTMTVSPATVNTSAESGTEEVTIEFALNNYSENLPALPVAIERYIITFERTDCTTGCPVPQEFTIGSGAYVEAGDSFSESITLIPEQLKLSLPIAALRDDEYNPIANQSVPVDVDSSEILAKGKTEVIARYGTSQEEFVATGDNSTTVFSGTVLNPPIIKGTFRVLVTGNVYGYLYETIGTGGSYSYTYTLSNTPVVPGSVSIVVYNNKRVAVIGTGDNTTTDFSATLTPPVLGGSVVVKVDDTIAGSDDGSGNLYGSSITGSVDYATGKINISFAMPPVSGSTITVEYLNSTESLVASDDLYGQITGENGYTVSGYVDYTTGVLTINFGIPPFSDAVVGVFYLSSENEQKIEAGRDNGNGEIQGINLTGSVDYNSGYFMFFFEKAPYSGQQIYIAYTQGAGSSNPEEVIYTLKEIPIVPGSVVITDGTNVLATDDGNGNLNGSGAMGTVSYTEGNLILTILADTSQMDSLLAIYNTKVLSGTSMYPVVPGSIQISVGDTTCRDIPDGSETTATYGGLGYPCQGTIAYSDGTITDFGFFADSPEDNDIVISYKVRTSSYLGGDRNLATGDGHTTEFYLYLHYPPIESPHGDYAAVIATSDGFRAVDTGGGTLTGDVCPTKRSYIDYQTGSAYVCFSSPPSSGAEIFALYRTSSIRMNARIKAEGYEIGGKSISIERTVTITVN
jgi:hypothetical protein